MLPHTSGMRAALIDVALTGDVVKLDGPTLRRIAMVIGIDGNCNVFSLRVAIIVWRFNRYITEQDRNHERRH